MTSPDTTGKGIAGEDFDPFEGQQNTDDFYFNPLLLLLAIVQGIAELLGKKIQITSYAPFHNYRQWHVFEESLSAGWNNGAIKAGIVPAIPGCPKFWQDVSHYWNFGGILGIIAYELVAYIRIVLVVACLIIMVNIGHITPAQALTIILQQFGVSIA